MSRHFGEIENNPFKNVLKDHRAKYGENLIIQSNRVSFLIVVSLLASIVFTYLWATLTAPTSTVFAVLTLVAAAVFVISTNLITKR